MTILDYSNRVRSTKESLLIPFWILVLSTLLTGFTCGRAEYLNARLGFILPNVDVGRWRHASDGTEKWWRFERYLETGDNTWSTKTLSAADEHDLAIYIERTERKNSLLDHLQTFGLLQYPLVFANVILSLFFLVWGGSFRGRRWVALGLVLLNVIFGYLMIAHGYFSSLGM